MCILEVIALYASQAIIFTNKSVLLDLLLIHVTTSAQSLYLSINHQSHAYPHAQLPVIHQLLIVQQTQVK